MKLNENDWDSFISYNFQKNQNAFAGLANCKQYMMVKLEWFLTQCSLDQPDCPPSEAIVIDIFLNSNKEHIAYADLVDRVTIQIINQISQIFMQWKVNHSQRDAAA